MSSSIQSAGDLAITQSMGPSLAVRAVRPSAGAGIEKAAQDFEGMFMSQMLQPMFDTVGVDPLFGGGHGEEMMRSFLVQEYGKVMANNTNFGITAAVRDELVRAQQGQQKTRAATASLNYGATNAAGQVQ